MWQAGRLELAQADLDGRTISVSASGVMAADQSLAFKANWTAHGPFRAGPLELSGQIKGTGELTGTRAAPRLGVLANIDQIDVPRLPLRDARAVLTFARQTSGVGGALTFTAASDYGPTRLQAGFGLSPDGVDLSGVAFDGAGVRARGAIALRSLTASAANLDIMIGPGAFLAAGTLAGDLSIVAQADGTRARLELRAERARWSGSGITVRSGRLTAEGPLSRIPYRVTADGGSGQGGWSLSGEGALVEDGDARLLTFDGSGRTGKRDLHTTDTARFRFSAEGRTARVRLAGANGGLLNVDGDWRAGVADVRAQVADMNLGLFNPDLDGGVDGTLSLKGEGRRLDGVLQARLSAARARGSPAGQGLNGTLNARLAGDELVVQASATNPQGLTASADMTLPAEATAAPFRVAVARQRPLRGRFSAEGEVRPLWDLLIGGGRALSGQVRTQGTLGGTMSDPKVSGSFAVERGRFDDVASGLSLRDVAARADLEQDSVNIIEASGADARAGRITGQGRVSLVRAGASTLRLNLQGFRLIDNEVATANASGLATITRGADGQVKLSGDLTLDRADVAAEPPVPSGVVAMDVVELNRPDILPATLAPRARRGDGWGLDVRLHAPRRVFLKGRGLDVEFSLDAHVGGSTAHADLTGAARVIRGDYDFAGKRFAFDDRSVVYLSTRPENIRLQLDAKREDPSLAVGVRIRGTAARPEISFVSTPSLPNDEVLAQLLFGRSASQLSPVEAAQLASALSSLAGGGGLDVIGNLRNFAGLDRLAFAGGNAAGVTVSGGKYLTDDVYLELTGGGREGPSAQVEWRIRRNLSILSKLAGQAGNRLAVRWRKDY
jgi:translocation and assembly module TamB